MYQGEKVVLRAYERSDLEKLHRIYNDYEMMRFLALGPIFPKSLEDEAKIIEDISKDREKSYAFAIQSIDGELLGSCGYNSLDRKNGTVLVGISIGDSNNWGKGYGTDAMRVLLRFLFGELNIRKVCLEVFDFNERAIKSYEKIGFKVEGRLKEQTFRDGKYCDNILMAIFQKDFLKVK